MAIGLLGGHCELPAFQVWDTRAWECVLDIGVESPMLCCAFTWPQSQSNDSWKTRQGGTFDPLEHSLASPAQLFVAAGCQDGTVRIFDLRCGVAQQALLGHTGEQHYSLSALSHVSPLSVMAFPNPHKRSSISSLVTFNCRSALYRISSSMAQLGLYLRFQ